MTGKTKFSPFFLLLLILISGLINALFLSLTFYRSFHLDSKMISSFILKLDEKKINQSFSLLEKAGEEERNLLISLPLTTPGPAVKVINEEANPANFKVEILNGSGRAGLAGVMAEKLRNSGFNVIKVENASYQGYEKTLIKTKPEIGFLRRRIEEVLKPEVSFFEESDLNQESIIDISVILGK